MCASYMIKQRQNVWQDFYHVKRSDIEDFFDLLIVPHHMAPAYVLENGDIVMKPMRFSLVPRWSKEARPKFATHNARLETVAEKPTWKEAFQKRHCLIPMTDFIEPIYDGNFAGNMVAFHRQGGDLLFAAGIWEEWTNRETGEFIESFAVVTSNPPQFIFDTGHDRCPMFLDAERGKEWLFLSEKPTTMIEFLEANRDDVAFDVEIQRPMKPGWEKRK